MKLRVFLLSLLSFLVAVAPAKGEILEIKLRKDMPYPEAKQTLINAGWQYDSLPAYGYQSSDQKVISECHGQVKICSAYPELQNCSADGYCLMLFYDHFGNELTVTTYGEVMSSTLPVIGWRVKH